MIDEHQKHPAQESVSAELTRLATGGGVSFSSIAAYATIKQPSYGVTPGGWLCEVIRYTGIRRSRRDRSAIVNLFDFDGTYVCTESQTATSSMLFAMRMDRYSQEHDWYRLVSRPSFLHRINHSQYIEEAELMTMHRYCLV